MGTMTERKPLDYYLNLKYSITIIPDESGGFAAEIEDLPGCITQGDTLEETYSNMEEARKLWLETVYEDGQYIPLPNQEVEYSGKFILRAPKSLHRKLDRMACREGVSLNQYLVATLSEAVGQLEGRSRHPKVKKSKTSTK